MPIKTIAKKNNLRLNEPIIDFNNKSVLVYCKVRDLKKNIEKLKSK